MIMKNCPIYKIFTFCLTVLLLQACSTADEPFLPEPTEGVQRFIELNLASGVQTRTQDPDKAGDENESYVGVIDIYLKKEGDNKLIFVGRASLNAMTAKVLVPNSIASGEYYLYVVGNPYSTNPESSYSGFIYEHEATNPSDLWRSRSFLMANTTNNLKPEYNDVNGGVKINIPESTDAEAAVDLERLAVKVTTDCSELKVDEIMKCPIMSPTGAEYPIKKVTIVETALVNCVNSFNMIQQWNDNMLNQKPINSSATIKLNLITPSSSPYYNIKTGYYNKPTDEKIEYVNQGDAMFCLENNAPYYEESLTGTTIARSTTKMKGRATAVLFKIQVKWKADDEDQTFYRFGNKLFSDFETLKSEYGVTEDNEAVKCYKNGYMYHIYWLKDGKYVNEAGDPYYAVMRNTWFELKIMKIGWGTDSPGDEYDPEDPIDSEDMDFGVILKVNRWKLHDIVHELK